MYDLHKVSLRVESRSPWRKLDAWCPTPRTTTGRPKQTVATRLVTVTKPKKLGFEEE
jgi:hypothetical protein